MKKFKKYILLILCLTVAIFSLTACSNSYEFTAVPGGNPNAPTESNGGQVVKQGDKLYFVNGKSDENTANKFGEVLKGGIVRATIDEKDGSLKDFVTIVPKNVYSKGANSGFYIFGGSIYYMTPNNEVDKNDNLLNDRLDVMKVNLNGTGTQKLGTIMGLDFQYKFVNGYLVYYKNNTITICKMEENLPAVKTIKDVTGIVMPKTEYYEKGKEYASDYIFYTRSLTDDESKDGSKNNMLCAVKCDGTNQIDIIGKTTTFADSTIAKNEYTTTLKNYLVDGENITIFYTRKDAINGQLSEKLYSYTFKVADLKQEKDKVYFNKENEKLIFNNAVSSFTPYASDSVVEISDKTIYLYKNGVKTQLTYIGDAGVFDGTLVQFRKEKVGEDNVVMMYYTKSTGMFKVVFERNGNVAIEAPEKIYDGAIGANVFGNEFIGDYFYFDYSAKKDYVYRINVNKVSTTEKLEEGSSKVNPELVGKMTKADADALKKEEEEKK